MHVYNFYMSSSRNLTQRSLPMLTVGCCPYTVLEQDACNIHAPPVRRPMQGCPLAFVPGSCTRQAITEKCARSTCLSATAMVGAHDMRWRSRGNRRDSGLGGSVRRGAVLGSSWADRRRSRHATLLRFLRRHGLGRHVDLRSRLVIVRHERCDRTQRFQLSRSLLRSSLHDYKFRLELECLKLSRANQN
ncbi:hypothetical protein BC826DRAFT_977011 [Russula brevipes]|nr:hypothetical protein BC826DRAFT_977011 [Russula brevipes]